MSTSAAIIVLFLWQNYSHILIVITLTDALKTVPMIILGYVQSATKHKLSTQPVSQMCLQICSHPCQLSQHYTINDQEVRILLE